MKHKKWKNINTKKSCSVCLLFENTLVLLAGVNKIFKLNYDESIYSYFNGIFKMYLHSQKWLAKTKTNS